ncbi:hypothetical protein PIB30_002954 [Stylosanthes scabra]|uniref:glucan endo-1,3-beta-D-glucosidase n=1 Tax=Stylosanthes scabra TaxID=79078 RepID=A0ABU6V3H2_9FABA|nr:hypothetical protein [Stylosanthes scabra]
MVLASSSLLWHHIFICGGVKMLLLWQLWFQRDSVILLKSWHHHLQLRSSPSFISENFVCFSADSFIGVNIGTYVSEMPSTKEIVALLKAQGIQHVRFYDADQSMLIALANTGICVIVSVPNDQLLGIGQSNATAKVQDLCA